MTPLVSVIMPVYNSEKYVEQSINCVLQQGYKNLELIIVNDGSTDSSLQIIQSIPDPRIKIISQANKGVKRLAETINVGLKECAGKYVTMMPSDDLWPLDRIERQIPHMEAEGDVVLCFGKQKLIDPQDKVIGETRAPKYPKKTRNDPIGSGLYEMFIWNYIPQPTVLIRKSALDAIGGYLQPSGLFAEDYPTHMELAKLGKFKYIEEYFALYRLHPNQMTRTHYPIMVETDVEFVKNFYNGLSGEVKNNCGWTDETLATAMSKRLNGAYFQVGRQQLLAHDWKNARSSFSRALKHGNLESKLKSVIGWTCALFKTDLERFTVLVKRSARIG